MSETLVRIIRIKFETALITPSRISLEVQPVYAESAWNEFAETVHTDGRLSSRGVVKIPAENPLVKFSFVMNSNGQHSHDIQCLNN